MCTMTWWRGAGNGYGVFFNRDEKKTRAKAEPPSIIDCGGVPCIAPRDPDAGGTWILSNAFGVTVAVLNAYQCEEVQPDNAGAGRRYRSRGEIPLVLGGSPDVQAASQRFASLDATVYRPFTVVILDPQSEISFRMDGSGKSKKLPAPVEQPVLSSSFAPLEVYAARRAAFATAIRCPNSPERNELSAFHRTTGDAPDACTPTMLRSDAQTFSLTALTIDSARVHCDYEAYPLEFDGLAEKSCCRITRVGA